MLRDADHERYDADLKERESIIEELSGLLRERENVIANFLLKESSMKAKE